MTYQEAFWLTVGGTAQLIFTTRMVIQWWVSERRGSSVVPPSFWYLSLVGGTCMLSYAIWRRDPVFVVGQVGGLFVYARNVALLNPRRAAAERQATSPGPTSSSPPSVSAA